MVVVRWPIGRVGAVCWCCPLLGSANICRRRNPRGKTVEVTCPCGKALSLRDELAGKRGRCPKVREPLRVPTLESLAAEAPQETDAPEDEPVPDRKKKRASALD